MVRPGETAELWARAERAEAEPKSGAERRARLECLAEAERKAEADVERKDRRRKLLHESAKGSDL